MTPERLAEITDRAARGTPPPWSVGRGEDADGYRIFQIEGADGTVVTETTASEADDAFICAARQDIVDLVGALRELQGLQSDAIGELLATVEVLHRLTRDMELACYFVPAEQLMERAGVLEGLAVRLREASGR